VEKIYAIVETGGKQYKVTPGQTLDIERLDVSEGDTVELDKVLLIDDDGKVKVGTPLVKGAKVMATSQGEGRGKKIIVFKYKSKVRYRRKKGHRQPYTRLTIDEIIGSGVKPSQPKKKVQKGKKDEVKASGS